MATIQELRDRAKREQERKRREEQNRPVQESFRNDGFFESTNYSNYDSPSSSSGGCDSGSGGCD